MCVCRDSDVESTGSNPRRLLAGNSGNHVQTLLGSPRTLSADAEADRASVPSGRLSHSPLYLVTKYIGSLVYEINSQSDFQFIGSVSKHYWCASTRDQAKLYKSHKNKKKCSPGRVIVISAKTNFC